MAITNEFVLMDTVPAKLEASSKKAAGVVDLMTLLEVKATRLNQLNYLESKHCDSRLARSDWLLASGLVAAQTQVVE